ncbi:MAG: hypothetical protein SOX77_00255 [Candidatus Borkfalkiaceae bacterium]|nr:hypothetical protein [Christensenellaceae bacterium]
MSFCEICGQNPAEYKIEKIVDGQKIVRYVCRDCAEEFGDVKIAGETEKTCRVCGKTLNEINRDFTVGCEYCYTEFYKELYPVIKKVQKL